MSLEPWNGTADMNGFDQAIAEQVPQQRRSTLAPRSIKSLYPLAIAEGEGIGTAYEYFAKRLVLRRFLSQLPRPTTLLIAGLPEKYGSSLDFLLLADELDLATLVVDERPAALEKFCHSFAAAQSRGELSRVQPQHLCVQDLLHISEVKSTFDLCLSSEVLQRLPADTEKSYLARIATLSRASVIFAPNADNRSHTTISGLSGVTLAELLALEKWVGSISVSGYVDMPPFPPGITRSAEQRQKAASGLLEATAMWGLGQYARCEAFVPKPWRQSHAHIVYACVKAQQS